MTGALTMKPPGPVLFGALAVGVALYLWQRRSAAAVAAAGVTTDRNADRATTRAINTNPELWSALGLTSVRDSLLSGQVLQLPDFGRARITDTEDARLYAAVIPPPENANETAAELWDRAGPAVPRPVLDLLSWWNGLTETQAPRVRADLLAACEPRPALIPQPGDGAQLDFRAAFERAPRLAIN
jgi:hypothetical protein